MKQPSFDDAFCVRISYLRLFGCRLPPSNRKKLKNINQNAERTVRALMENYKVMKVV